MDNQQIEATIDAAADKAKELTSKLDEARSDAHKVEDAISSAQNAAALNAKQRERRLNERVLGGARRVQTAFARLGRRAGQMAKKLSGHAQGVARKLQRPKPADPHRQLESQAGNAPEPSRPVTIESSPAQNA